MTLTGWHFLLPGSSGRGLSFQAIAGWTSGKGQASAWLAAVATATSALLIRVTDRVAQWQEQSASRAQLLTLDEAALHDLGLSRTEAEAEASRAFWK